MGDLDSLTSLDGLIFAILIIALARGLFIGLVRESFSIAALAAAVLITRYATRPVSEWAASLLGDSINSGILFWGTGSLIAICTVLCVALVGRVIRKGVRIAGLSWADRIGGAAFGLSEGIIVGLLIVLGATWALGRDHPAIENSKSLKAYETVRSYLSESGRELPELAPPSRWL